MSAEHRIQGLFSGGAPARACEDGSGLRARPRAAGERDSLPDLSDQARELPDEDDLLDGLGASDTLPPTRGFRATLVEERLRASQAGRPKSEPPPLPVELHRRRPPALPVPLTRRTVPSDSGRISFGEVARATAAVGSVRPGPVDDVGALRDSLDRRARRRRSGRWALGAVAFAACFGLGFGVVELARPDAPETPRAATSVEPAAEPSDTPSSAAATSAPAAVGAPVAVDPPVGVVELGEVVVVRSPRREAAEQEPRNEARRPRRGALRAPGVAATAEPEVDPAPEPEEATAEEAASVARAEPDLPATPSREAVLAAVHGVEADVRACAEGASHHGVVPVRITVAPSGRVTTALVRGGGLVGTPAGSCIARAVRGARFPAFSQPHFSVDYPFSL